MSKKYRPNSSHRKNDFASYLKANLKRRRDPRSYHWASVESPVDYLYNTFNNQNKGAKNGISN